MIVPVLAVLWGAAVGQPARQVVVHTFSVLEARADAVSTIVASCAGCDWGLAGREAAAVRITLDGVYSQHLLLTQGSTPSEYRVSLGTLAKGDHNLQIEADPSLSAKDAGPPVIASVDTRVGDPSEDTVAQSMAPILYARPNT